jgi:hypothetical protein
VFGGEVEAKGVDAGMEIVEAVRANTVRAAPMEVGPESRLGEIVEIAAARGDDGKPVNHGLPPSG